MITRLVSLAPYGKKRNQMFVEDKENDEQLKKKKTTKLYLF